MAEYVFTESMVAEQVEGARAFIAAARTILAEGGWTST